MKAKANLVDFPLLVVLQDPDLINLISCDARLSDPNGLDISFTSVSSPAVPLNFQLDSYDGAKGTLQCWVRLDQLFAPGSSGLNELYLYYGSNILNDPFGQAGTAVWSLDHERVWHMNPDLAPATIRTANQQSGKAAYGTPSVQSSSFVPGKIGRALQFNGITDALYSSRDTNTSICITAWIKPLVIGKEQVIITNDSAGRAGYRIGLDVLGRLIFEVIVGSSTNRVINVNPLPLGKWTHFAVVISNMQRRIYINGVLTGSFGTIFKLLSGGSIRVGSGKQPSQYFEGSIDELRIQRVFHGTDWINTLHENQNEPETFLTVFMEEVNPIQTLIASTFTNASGTQAWADPRNWADGKVPAKKSNVIVKSHETARLDRDTKIGKLILEQFAQIENRAGLEVNCLLNMASDASILLSERSYLEIKSDLINEGQINGSGTIVLSGAQPLQTLSGGGKINVGHLELVRSHQTNQSSLQTSVAIKNTVKLSKGVLYANGKLRLLANTSGTAALLPLMYPDSTAILGELTVEQLITGSFPAPATARGWRLITAPVYHGRKNNQNYYQVKDIQYRVFVTGPGGPGNGFDPSIYNGGTIYTHDQALPGSLAQKYSSLSTVQQELPFGKGIYLFSRGDRRLPDAYQKQIQGPVFSNPNAYIIDHQGYVFSGPLEVPLQNRDHGNPGDGFNLLGNPYPAGIVWSKLSKVNTGPFIWTFDAMNNAYRVTDDPNFVIPMGTGFFVRVNRGAATGSVAFLESSKAVDIGVVKDTGPLMAGLSEVCSDPVSRLQVRLSREGISDDYVLKFREGGSNAVTDADAPKIEGGYVSLAGIAEDGQLLAIEERDQVTKVTETRLLVKAWDMGSYKFSFSGLNELFNSNMTITLLDHRLNSRKVITEQEHTHHFYLSQAEARSGSDRFSLLFQSKSNVETPALDVAKNLLQIYPNPFSSDFYVRTKNLSINKPELIVRDIMGKVMLTIEHSPLSPDQDFKVENLDLPAGIYLLELREQQSHKLISTLKMIKNE